MEDKHTLIPHDTESGVFYRVQIEDSDYVVNVFPDEAKKKELAAILAETGLKPNEGWALDEVVHGAIFRELDSSFFVGFDADQPDGRITFYLKPMEPVKPLESLEEKFAAIKKQYPGLAYEIEDRRNLPDDNPIVE